MTYALPSETSYNFSSGIDQSILYLTSQIPTLPTTLLSVLFIMIMFGGFMGTKRTEGKNQLFLWWSIAGLLTVLVAFLLFSIQIIPLTVVTLYFIVTVVGVILYFGT